MTTPEIPKAIGEIEIAEQLKDVAWQHLPAKAREARQLVEVAYYPLAETVVRLIIKYDPHDRSLSIETEEVVSTTETEVPDSFRKFMHYRGVDLDADMGEVIMYGENTDVRDEHDRVIESPEEFIETDAEPLSAEWQAEYALRAAADQLLRSLETNAFNTFTQDKLDYLLGLFDKI